MKSLQDRLPKSFATPQELAEAISKITGHKVKKVRGTVSFKDMGGYGAVTFAEDIYEVAFDEEHKCQIGTAVSHTKDWMNSVPGEIVIRTAQKETTLSGKRIFQWNWDAISSYKPESDFEEYLHTTGYGQASLFRSLI